MNKTNLKPLAWGLLGAGVAVMGTAGALDLPSWLRHPTAVTAPGAGGTSAAIAAAATGQQVAPRRPARTGDVVLMLASC